MIIFIRIRCRARHSGPNNSPLRRGLMFDNPLGNSDFSLVASVVTACYRDQYKMLQKCGHSPSIGLRTLHRPRNTTQAPEHAIRYQPRSALPRSFRDAAHHEAPGDIPAFHDRVRLMVGRPALGGRTPDAVYRIRNETEQSDWQARSVA